MRLHTFSHCGCTHIAIKYEITACSLYITYCSVNGTAGSVVASKLQGPICSSNCLCCYVCVGFLKVFLPQPENLPAGVKKDKLIPGRNNVNVHNNKGLASQN